MIPPYFKSQETNSKFQLLGMFWVGATQTVHLCMNGYLPVCAIRQAWIPARLRGQASMDTSPSARSGKQEYLPVCAVRQVGI